MSVVDASVVVDALVSRTDQGDMARHWLRTLDAIQAPAILGAEVASALRRLTSAGHVGEAVARAALSGVSRMRMVSYPFEPFWQRAWELRQAMTIYDAWYVALAEELDTTLTTTDRRLGKAEGVRCPIQVLDGSSSSDGD